MSVENGGENRCKLCFMMTDPMIRARMSFLDRELDAALGSSSPENEMRLRLRAIDMIQREILAVLTKILDKQ